MSGEIVQLRQGRPPSQHPSLALRNLPSSAESRALLPQIIRTLPLGHEVWKERRSAKEAGQKKDRCVHLNVRRSKKEIPCRESNPPRSRKRTGVQPLRAPDAQRAQTTNDPLLLRVSLPPHTSSPRFFSEPPLGAPETTEPSSRSQSRSARLSAFRFRPGWISPRCSMR